MFFLGSAQQSFGRFLLGLPNASQTLGSHVRIIRTLVVVGIDNNEDLVVIAIQQGNRAPGAEDVIVGMRRKDQNCFAMEVFEACLLRLSETKSEKQGTEKDEQVPHTRVLRTKQSTLAAIR